MESSDSTSSISPIMIGEIETTLLLSSKSTITIDDLELFVNLSFTHHVRILNGEKDVNKRWKYIRLSLENKWDTRSLHQQIKDNAADKYGVMASNFSVKIKDSRDAIKALNMFKDEYLLDFINTEEIGIRDIQDYAKPMGVATYRLSKDMPEKLREALPDVEELKNLL